MKVGAGKPRGGCDAHMGILLSYERHGSHTIKARGREYRGTRWGCQSPCDTTVDEESPETVSHRRPIGFGERPPGKVGFISHWRKGNYDENAILLCGRPDNKN